MKYINYKRKDLERISTDYFKISIPNLKNVNKTEVLTEWFIQKIESGLKSSVFNIGVLLPKKADLAYALGVSLGTIQNVLRQLEDRDYIYSKQCIGSIIKNPSNSTSEIRKQTSKKDIAEEKIKQFIKESNLKTGDKLPVTRQLSKELDISLNTLRAAISSLATDKILEYNNKKELILKTNDFSINISKDEETLVTKVKEDLKQYICEKFKVGDKLTSHEELAKIFKVSIKTIHNAIQILTKENMLLPKRGAYGTTVINTSMNSAFEPRKEMSIFAPAQQTALYHYQKIQSKIENIIIERYDIGSKLPSIKQFSLLLDVSPNIIRKAFNNLAKDGILRFARGRYGGTYVINLPENNNQTFRWLAVNPQYAKVNV